MAKILLGIITVGVLAFIVFTMMCAMIVAGRSDEENNSRQNTEGADEMFWKKQICPKCKVGKWSYELDKHSEACPYIGCWKDGKCQFFEPINDSSKKGIFSGLINKRSVTPPKNKALCGF